MTGGHGADCTLMTAATKSNAVINLAMELTRAKGTVGLPATSVSTSIARSSIGRKSIC
jgi:threonine dehydrogenase-like Zn-dependent dehydrogenase